jgi:hypothetical protein
MFKAKAMGRGQSFGLSPMAAAAAAAAADKK